MDGTLLAHMMQSGAKNLYNNKQIVDELNVFPVPDGDTGTNMSMTAMAMRTALNEVVSSSVSGVADTASYATLRGARGNSGVILSQFFRGMSKVLKGKQTCSALDFARALKQGSDAAYKAVMNPTEGTILTVAREAAEAALKEAEKGSDVCKMMKAAVSCGNAALAKTPEMLPMLKKAGVVDAGGKGWMTFLEGALYYLEQGEEISSEAEPISTAAAKPGIAQQAIDTKNIKYTYCTEFIVEKKNKDVQVMAFRKAIETKGDSMLVIDDDEIVKVHIHTNNPGYVLERAVLLGAMTHIKIDNMAHQHQSLIENAEPKYEEPKKAAEHKDNAFVAICAGDGIESIFRDLGIDEIVTGGQTMNPSTEDILGAINNLDADAIFVFPNNKNIIMAAEQAQKISDKNVVVIPTKTIPQCCAAMLAFNGNKDAEANEKAMNRAISEIKTGQVTYAVRDTEIEGQQIKEGDILGMQEGKIVVTGKDYFDVCRDVVLKMADEDSEFLTVYYGADVTAEEAEAFAERLEEQYEDLEVSMQYGGQALYYFIISVE